MIIQSGNVAMASRRSYERTTAVSSSLSLWGGGGLSVNSAAVAAEHYREESGSGEESPSSAGNFNESLFHKFKQAQSITPSLAVSRQAPDLDAIQKQSINYLLMLLFGKNTVSLSRLTGGLNGLYAGSAPSMQGMGGSYSESVSYSEEETTTFTTDGTVKTADGREINFHLSIAMSRSFEESYAGSVQFGEALNQAKLCDPLVINLNSSPAHVSDQKFYFDLDCDGKPDQISKLASGSGFLALDKNGDGKINDGSELFGTKSGDGFADLAAYDEDGNGWIDENDPIFDKLRIWTKDAGGKDRLIAIGKAGIGAIYLGSEQTDFSLNSAKDNSTNALVRKTGIFLYENGNCGTIQHLDMVT